MEKDKCFITVKHSYNAGDLIVLMAGLKKLFQTYHKQIIIYQVIDFPAFYYTGAYSPIKDESGQQVCMNMDMFLRLKPLIEYQEYIHSFEIYKGETVDFDIDKTRDSRMIPMPAGLLHFYNFGIFPEMSCDMSKPWIDCPKPDCKKELFLINRTHRYTNAYINYFFVKSFQKSFNFVGSVDERATFEKDYDVKLELVQSENFLQLATIMRSYKGGIYNQSFLFHLAEAMKLTRILELCNQFPNTFPCGANGVGFYHQSALEFFTHKMMRNDLRI